MKRICGDGVSIGGPQPLPGPPCHKPHHDASRYACSRKSASLHWPRADTGDTQRLRISRIIHRGTSAMLNTSLSPWPAYSEEEAQAAARVIASGHVNYWTGEEGRAFRSDKRRVGQECVRKCRSRW